MLLIFLDLFFFLGSIVGTIYTVYFLMEKLKRVDSNEKKAKLNQIVPTENNTVPSSAVSNADKAWSLPGDGDNSKTSDKKKCSTKVKTAINYFKDKELTKEEVEKALQKEKFTEEEIEQVLIHV